MTKQQTKIEETEKRLQFTIVLGLFFPVILEAFFNFNGSNSKDVSEIVLKSGAVIFVLILNYLLFEWRKSHMSAFKLKALNWVYLSTTTCYALVILFFGFVANGDLQKVNWSVGIMYPAILFGSMYIPVIGLFVVGWDFFSERLKKNKSDV